MNCQSLWMTHTNGFCKASQIPSERPPSERPPSDSERSVIITDDINRLLQYLHGLEGDRQRDNQGVHDHLREIQNELHGLRITFTRTRRKLQFKDQPVGGGSGVSQPSPHEAPLPFPVARNAILQVVSSPVHVFVLTCMHVTNADILINKK